MAVCASPSIQSTNKENMGHYTEIRVGVGKTQKDAWYSVCDEYRAEYGWSHNIAEEPEKATLLEKVPPDKQVEEIVRPTSWSSHTVIKTVPDKDAPQDKWLEKWEFTFDVHV